MEINIDCVRGSGYFQARVESDSLENPIETADMHDAMNAIAVAALQLLMKTGEVKLVINGKSVEPKVTEHPEDEEDYEVFFEEGDWMYTHDIL